MKQVSGLPIVGKKMTREAMKALKGGGSVARGCPLDMLVGWVCPSNSCCYQSQGQCNSNCYLFGCSQGLCPA